MTPLEKALRTPREIDYCDQCEHVRIVDEVGYCGISGKILHPLMYMRGQGYGPARRCDRRKNREHT
jgi:hypothetical protein